MRLLRAIFTVSGLTMVSRVLGFTRDILIANLLGAGMVADAFFVAFKLPNFFRRLFAEGAFNAAFVPLFTESLTRQGQASAREFAEEALAVLLAVLLLTVTAFQIAMPLIMAGLAYGFLDEPEKFDLTVQFSRLTFAYLLFISLVSLMSGLLNSVGRFAAAAAAPILLNLCLITALLVAAPRLPTAGHALAWGVALAGIVQFVWLLAACRRAGLALRLPWPRLTPRVRRLLVLLLPMALAAGVVQVNMLIDIFLASLLPEGSVSFLYYADRLNQLPIGVVGVAVGTALLPMLSRQVAAGDMGEALAGQNRAIEVALFFTLPAAAALLVVPLPIIAVLFERGHFDGAASLATSYALMGYAVGLPAYVLVKVLGPGFFARQDTATPFKIGVAAVIVNVVLNVILMIPLKHAGLALATAISAWVNCGLMAFILARRGHLVVDSRLKARLPRTLLAALAMAAGLWAAAELLTPYFAAGQVERILALAALVAIGFALFGLGAQLTGAARLGELKGLLRRGAS